MGLSVERTALDGVLILTPDRFGDKRGFFCETYVRKRYADAGIDADFVQDNLSLSEAAGTLRGLHFQAPPYAQAKLVQCMRGAILDVAVDIRRSSPTYGQHVGVRLSAKNGRQLYVPAGFAHGFCTLEPGCLVAYKTSDYYAPAHDKGLAYNDPALEIAWPFPSDALVLSGKDKTHPKLVELPAYFE